jgi:hypothetical protein
LNVGVWFSRLLLLLAGTGQRRPLLPETDMLREEWKNKLVLDLPGYLYPTAIASVLTAIGALFVLARFDSAQSPLPSALVRIAGMGRQRRSRGLSARISGVFTTLSIGFGLLIFRSGLFTSFGSVCSWGPCSEHMPSSLAFSERISRQ